MQEEDPRTTTKASETDKLIPFVQVPTKWTDVDSTSMGEVSFPVASWAEALLIQAEAALHRSTSDGAWLQKLNLLRATGVVPGTDHPTSTQLPPLRDPGTERGRISLVFAERAYWLFLTGHRQGDLRRLVREYGWPQDEVYPTGAYVVPEGLIGQVGTYGTDVTMPIPPEERANPRFHGCMDRKA